MKKQYSILWLISLGVSAQQVVSSAGSTFSQAGGSISWTLGEVATETFKTSKNTTTQGMQQGTLTVITDLQESHWAGNVSIYPNPTSQYVQIWAEEATSVKYSYILSELNGQVISQGTIREHTSLLNLEPLPRAIYLLKIIKDSKETNTYKIIKQ